MSVGLALSGGGAKGIAHLGVIEALQDNNINIDYISGSSSGSVMAAMYMAGYSPNEILDIVIENIKNNKILDYDNQAGFKVMKMMFTRRASLSGFIKGDKLEKLLEKYLLKKNIIDISDLKKSIAIPVVNIKTGEVVYYLNKEVDIKEKKNLMSTITKTKSIGDKYINDKSIQYDDIPEYRYRGNVSEIVRASSSFPVVFKPKKIGNEWYVDGGVRVNSPVEVLKDMGADFVIAISFNCNKIDKSAMKNIVGITSQALDLLMHESSEAELEKADINVRICAKEISLLDFSKPVYLAQKGYNIINNNINYIKKKIVENDKNKS